MSIEAEDRVRVVKLIDDEANKDYLNKEGTVIKKYTYGMVGDSKEHPLYSIDFDDGIESYWAEKLEKIE